MDHWVEVSAERHDADGDLAELVDDPAAARAFDDCPPAAVTYFQTRPLLAYLLGDRRPNDIETTRAERAEPGATLVARGEAEMAPPPFRVAAENGSWRVLCRR